MASMLAAGLAAPFRSRPLAPPLLAQADLVLTAEAAHRSRILADHPQYVRTVHTVGQFADFAAAHPELRGADLVRGAGRRRTAPLPEQDISDPYRLGEQAARAAADRIDAMLRIIVPALSVDAAESV
jgi:protein-tyrosine-phosphatase